MDKFLMICYINEQILFIYFCEPLLLVAKCRRDATFAELSIAGAKICQRRGL